MRTLGAHAARDLRAGNLEVVPVRTAQGQRLRLFGELDISTAPDLLAAAREVVGAGAPPSQLELDFGALDFVDSTGLGAVLQIATLCEQCGWGLALLSPRRGARRMLAMARLSERLVIRDL